MRVLPANAPEGTVARMSDSNDKPRAEFPPAHYWRRWAADAGAPQVASGDGSPVEAELAQVAAEATPTEAGESPYRVLIVEDDRSQALFAETVLRNAGIESQVVSVTSEVMDALESFRPELVLMDLHMPGMDGTELTAMIRRHPTLGLTPIVFLTGDPDPERQFEVLQIGADDFLNKPIRPRHLIAAVQGRVERARAQRQLRGDGRHPTTGLLTRVRMLQRLETEIPGSTGGALAFIEIESTAALRDRFGYAALETVLTDAGRRIGELAGDQPVTRLNDNTFLLHAPTVADGELMEWSRGLRDGIGRHAFSVGDEPLRLRALVGYAALSHGFRDAASALAASEQALREARATPVGIGAYAPPRAVDTAARSGMVDLVQEALAGNGLELAYQPIVAVAGGDDAQYQTLVRLRAPDGTVHTAAQILPAAEAAGLIQDVDRLVLELAVEMLQRRRDEKAPVRLLVPQSPRTLVGDGYAQHVISLIESRGLPGGALVVDVRQEDALIHAVLLQDFCAAMVPAGVQLCLSQYSASAEADVLLAQLPLGFVRLSGRYSNQLDDTAVRDEMRAAIERAHRLGLQVIGQQVEDPQAAATLWMSGVDYIQGNLVQKAAGALDFDFQHSVL